MHFLHHTILICASMQSFDISDHTALFFETLNMVQASNSLFSDRKGLMSRRKLVVNCQLPGDG